MAKKVAKCLFLLALMTAVAGAAKYVEIRLKSHPMIYFSGDDVAELRSRTSTTHEKIARDIRNAGKALLTHQNFYLPPQNHSVFASRWNEVYGNNLCAFAMYCFLYPQDDKVLELVKIYMDRMANYPDWYVKESYEKDEVPIGHSMVGMATAFDILYDRFDPTRRKNYYEAIKKTSKQLYAVLSSGKHGWAKQYIHNHAASNIVALLLGALVVSVKEPKLAAPWLAEAKEHLDTAMEILRHVTDGSLDEGVAYGSYTSRGLTLYVFLAKRHLRTDHTKNPWLKRHYWFYYYTILPGFQRSVGIGDANHNWFYGPASQLVFLDSYVMQNGYGNWLASKIRKAKPKNKPLAPSNAGLMCMMHTEYIFYNASIRPLAPPSCSRRKLHVYSDWGVVTYGGGQNMKKGNTFLSFKSGVPNGEAVESIMYENLYPQKVKGWTNFNPGHEHPDHNSFIFAPNGRYFITEALYGPKFTFLDNVYSFGPSNTSRCNSPWEGQIGDCSKWLGYRQFQKGMRGEILTAATSEDMVFIAGEAAGMYRESIGISSFFRGVLLLNPEVLIVVDSIRLRPGSSTTVASATFHNMLHRFKDFSHLGYNGAQVYYPEGTYRMFSIKVGGGLVGVTLHAGVQPQYLREGPTNYVNVTYTLLKEVTHVVHIFSGPNYVIKQASAAVNPKYAGVTIELSVNNQEYVADVSTSTRTRSKKRSSVKDRISATGFAGYARVRTESKNHYFGFKSESHKLRTYEANVEEHVDTVHDGTASSFKYTLSSSEECDRPVFEPAPLGSAKSEKEWIWRYGPPSSAVVVLLLVVVVTVLRTKIRLARKFRRPAFICISLLALLLVVANYCCIDPKGRNSCLLKETAHQSQNAVNFEEAPTFSPSSFVFIASLPGFGVKLLESLFQDPDNFLFLSTAEKGMTIPVEGQSSSVPNLCVWTTEQNKHSIRATGWFSSLARRPVLHFNQMRDTDYAQRMRRQIREHPNRMTALSDDTGFWNTKLPWLRSVVGKENFMPILLVRDPRSWIHAVTNDRDRARRKKNLSALQSAYKHIERICDSSGGLKIPFAIWRFQRLATTRKSALSVSEQLAVVWTVAISAALSNEGGGHEELRPLHVVRFEDLVQNAEKTSTDIFSRIGFPLGIRHMNRLTRLARSEFFPLPYDGVITPDTLDSWKTGLPNTEIQKINNISCPLMKELNYSCVTSGAEFY